MRKLAAWITRQTQEKDRKHLLGFFVADWQQGNNDKPPNAQKISQAPGRNERSMLLQGRPVLQSHEAPSSQEARKATHTCGDQRKSVSSLTRYPNSCCKQPQLPTFGPTLCSIAGPCEFNEEFRSPLRNVFFHFLKSQGRAQLLPLVCGEAPVRTKHTTQDSS